MHCKLAFLSAHDGAFLVLLDMLTVGSGPTGQSCPNRRFLDENDFIEKVLYANFGREETIDLIATTLLAAADRLKANHWLSLDLGDDGLESLGFDLYGSSLMEDVPLLSEDLHLQNVLLQAPLAVIMLSGPEHRVGFINPAYMKVMGRTNAGSVLGRSIREVLPELEGAPFFGLLDAVYRTGNAYVGVELRAEILNRESGTVEESYFDFIYHPLRDQDGLVNGILCIANDVRDRVLSRQVSESREKQLFRQWAELETIYQQSPIGMCLLDSKDYRILRLNDRQAELMGAPAETLLGKKVLDVFPSFSDLQALYERVAAGGAVTNFELTTALPYAPDVLRSWLLNFTPVVDAFGEVEMIASTALEITPKDLNQPQTQRPS